MTTILLCLALLSDVRPELTVTAYHYLLGLDNLALTAAGAYATLSSKTSGVRLNGVLQGISYALAYAQQKDYADNPWAHITRIIKAIDDGSYEYFYPPKQMTQK